MEATTVLMPLLRRRTVQSRKLVKRIMQAALTCSLLLGLAGGSWLLTRQRPYPRGVQFRAPHQPILAAAIDAVWFRPYNPPILAKLPQSWIATVYAAGVMPPPCPVKQICNNLTGGESNSKCTGYCAGMFDQFCEPTTANSYCSQASTSCGSGGTCIRASNSSCNPPN